MSFVGLILLAAQFWFSDHCNLWSNESLSQCIVPPAFGSFSIVRNLFDQLWQCPSCCHQPSAHPAEMPHEEHDWKLVDNFANLFNSHRKQSFTPGTTVCVNESMVRWHGSGGDWINHGLPMCMPMDCKPENGAEVCLSAAVTVESG